MMVKSIFVMFEFLWSVIFSFSRSSRVGSRALSRAFGNNVEWTTFRFVVDAADVLTKHAHAISRTPAQEDHGQPGCQHVSEVRGAKKRKAR